MPIEATVPGYSGGVLVTVHPVVLDEYAYSAAPAFIWQEGLERAYAAGIPGELVSLNFGTSAGVQQTWQEPHGTLRSGGVCYAWFESERVAANISGAIANGLPSLEFATSAATGATLIERLIRLYSAAIAYPLEQPIEDLATSRSGGIAYPFTETPEPLLVSVSAGVLPELVESIEIVAALFSGGVIQGAEQPIEATGLGVSGGVLVAVIQSTELVTVAASGGVAAGVEQPIEALTVAASGGVGFRDLVDALISGATGCDLVQLAGQPIEIAVSAGVSAAIEQDTETVVALISGAVVAGIIQPIEAIVSGVSAAVNWGIEQPIEPVEKLLSAAINHGAEQITEQVALSVSAGTTSGLTEFNAAGPAYSAGNSGWLGWG